MPKLLVSQAAEAVNLSRKTLYRHIKEGKLSSEKDDQNNVVIDISELQRVYDSVSLDENGNPASVSNEKTQEKTTETRLLELKLEAMTRERDNERERRQAAEGREEKLQVQLQVMTEIIKSQTRQLAAPKESELETPKAKRGFWARLFGS